MPLFAELLDLDDAARAARLAEACAGREALRAEVETLLDAAARGTAYFEGLRRRLGLPGRLEGGGIETGQVGAPPGGEQVGAQIGPYRLLRELGAGGMGRVWLAEHTHLLQGRQVALKLPHLEAVGAPWHRRARLAERLARERAILATLEHPNIARLYDAGVTAAGQPWLALERVPGERIDTFCRSRALPVAERLALFLQVARAVAHAHGQLVVHRDLKPANILVTESAGAAEVKLLDFGIAKLLQDEAEDGPSPPADGQAAEGAEAAGRAGTAATAGATGAAEGDLTREAGRILTPDYASPEQILGQPIGTASDVYSLGVVLFELLADTRPYRLARPTAAALEEALAGGARRPSTRAPAARRAPLRGDLDSIVLKALERAPGERYATVAALAEDVRRHLAHEPVLARPDGAAYRLRRFVRRHRLAFAASVALGAALAAGVAGTAWQAGVARAEQQRAEAVKDFVSGLFTDIDPFASRSREATVEGLLQSAQQRLDLAAGVTPTVRVELLAMIGESYAGLERLDRAEVLLDQALAEAGRDLGAGHPLSQRVRLARLKVWRHRGRLADMRAELAALLPALRAGRAPAERRALQEAVTMAAHLAIDEGRHDAAHAAAEEAVALATALYGAQHPAVAEALVVLATATQFLGDAEAALREAERARRVAAQVHGDDHARVLDARMLYGVALHDAGRFAAARAELEDVRVKLQARLGDTAPTVAYVANDLSRLALDLGDEAAALAHEQQSLSIHQRHAAPDALPVAMARRQHGTALLALHRGDEAAIELAQALAALTAARGAGAPRARRQGARRGAAPGQRGRGA
ncbi:MAG: serine/threonine-protein kinase, partial [Burkholderiaceae bacterium]|nr:serine/threonine-protein kinase [Burkholderiaceae bacterium]